MEEVEEFQRGKLGCFYKKLLPPGTTATRLYLPMLGQVLPDTQPTTGGKKRTFSEIIQSDITETSSHHIVAMVARSGSGKTATVIHLAKKHFVIYVVCEAVNTYYYSPDFSDRNFRILARDIENMCSRLPKPVQVDENRQKYMDDLRSYDNQLKNLASECVQLEFLARQLFLELLFRKNPQVTPEAFFREQLNGSATIGNLVEELRMPCDCTDEAHIAETDCLHDRLISPSAITNNENFLDRNGTIRLDLRHGFLTPLCSALGDMHATLVVLGTRLTLMDASHVYSAIAKPNVRFEKITSFPSCDESHVEELLGQIIDISDCEIQPEKKRRLSGRFRFATSVAVQICNGKCSDTITIKHLLSWMVIAYKLKGGKIAFTQQDEFDFVNSGVCALREDSDGYHWVVEEPLVIEVLEEELRASEFDPEVLAYLDQFNAMLTNLGTNSAAKGEAFELLDIKDLPEWCKTTTLNVRKFGTAKELGYDDDSTWGDVKFFEKTPGGELLIPNNLTRPDGALLLEGKEHGLSLAIKLYSQPVSNSKHELNEGSSNLRNCFMTSENKVNSHIKDQRRRFTKTAFHKLKGILHIHLEFPRVSGGTPQSYVNGQDILVYIDGANMDTFFDESIEEYSQDMDILKKMLKHIWEQNDNNM
ncbi:7533_t:CDS:2, partial [Paraglomus brasilianum]